MGKYLWAFKMSFARDTAYRLGFFMGILRNLFLLLILYYVWLALSLESGQFAGFTASELTTYVFLAVVIRKFLSAGNTRRVSFDINDGTFSLYLTRPVNHFLFEYAQGLAERIAQTVIMTLAVIQVGAVLDIDFIVQTDVTLLLIFTASLLLAHILMYVMDYGMALIAFWSREAMGPKFLFDWAGDFLAGTYFPLTILSGPLLTIASALPFMYVLFAPLMIYLGKMTVDQSVSVLLIQIVFIILTGLATNLAWNRGLRRYSGEGM